MDKVDFVNLYLLCFKRQMLETKKASQREEACLGWNMTRKNAHPEKTTKLTGFHN